MRLSTRNLFPYMDLELGHPVNPHGQARHFSGLGMAVVYLSILQSLLPLSFQSDSD